MKLLSLAEKGRVSQYLFCSLSSPMPLMHTSREGGCGWLVNEPRLKSSVLAALLYLSVLFTNQNSSNDECEISGCPLISLLS
jgi:hypothetical protein